MRLTVLAVVLAAGVSAGCGAPSVPRARVTLAILGGVYFSVDPAVKVEGAMVEDSETLLRKAVSDLNAVKNLDFVLVAGDLLAGADGASLDRAKAILADLRAPYYMVLGAGDGASVAAGPGARAPAGLSRGAMTWAFQGHGFSGPEGNWSREVLPNLMVVGLDTVQPGRREGHVDARQLEWLEHTLAANSGKAVLVLSYHALAPMHALDEGGAWRHKLVDNAAEVRQVLERHPNVLAVLAGDCHFAEGHVAGRTVYLASPSVSIWPCAYHLLNLTPKSAEAVWVPVAPEDVERRAQERLLSSPELRGVFPPGEDGDTACVRLFGGKKMEVYALPDIRP
jgi:3',5'-cyclic AMP phosphodiesterase CpdA